MKDASNLGASFYTVKIKVCLAINVPINVNPQRKIECLLLR